jgi:parvulin-like peptidyl-prolyl isomerase
MQELADQEGVRAVSLGMVHEGQVEIKEFNQAAFELEEGGVSESVWSLYGYGLVYVPKLVAGRQMAFSELNLDLFSGEWLAARRAEAQEQFMKGLLDKAKLEFPE